MLKGCSQGIGVEPVVKYGNVKREGRSYTSEEVWEGKMCIVMCVCGGSVGVYTSTPVLFTTNAHTHIKLVLAVAVIT